MPLPTVLDRGRTGRYQYADAVLNSIGLIGYWRLGEKVGTAARDETGHHNGTYTNTPTLGVQSGYADLDSGITVNGSTQYVTMTTDTMYQVVQTGRMSWAAWVRPTSSAALQFFFAMGGAGAGAIWAWGMGRGLTPFNAGTGLCMFVWQDAGATHVSVDTGTGTVLDSAATWVHCVATLVDSAVLRIYLNGRFMKQSTTFTGPAGAGASPVTIGRRPFGDRSYFGDIDEVSIWNRALGDGEIADLYNSGRSF